MIIEKIHINNWSCCSGSHEIQIPYNGNKPITMVIAYNGMGKTSLMNAFLWCLHEMTTERFKKKEGFINDSVSIYDEATDSYTKEVSSFVSLTIKHNEERYLIKRMFKVGRETETTLEVFNIKDDGNNVSITTDDPQAFVDSIVPPSMAKQFFFDGEGVIKLVDDSNSDNKKESQLGRQVIKNRVHSVIGLDPASTSLKQVQGLIISAKREKTKVGGNDTGGNKESPEKELSKILDEINEIENVTDGTGTLIDENNKYSELKTKYEKAKQDSQKYKNLKAEVELKEQLIIVKNQAYKKFELAKKKYLEALSSNQIINFMMQEEGEKAKELFKENKSPRYPGKMHREIIDELLANEECLCGRPLKKKGDEEAYKHIERQMHRATNEESSQMYYDLKTAASNYAHFEETGDDDLSQAESELAIANSQFLLADDDYEKRGKVINTSKYKEKEARNIANKIDELEDLKEISAKKIGSLGAQLIALKEKEEKISKKISSSSTKGDLISKIDRKIRLLQVIEQIIRKEIKSNEELARSSIEKSVREYLKKYFIGDIKFYLTDDYQLKVIKPKSKKDKDKDTSGGESLLIGTGYVASLLQYCIGRKDNKYDLENDEEMWILKGTQLPFVIDSPFGGQGGRYRRGSCNIVSDSKAQVIYFLSETQADKTVYEALKDKVDKVYAMIGYRSGDESDETLEEIGNKGVSNKDDYLRWGESSEIFGVEYDKGGNDRTVFKVLNKNSWVDI